jgi:phospholipid/cholesterol/gamma-HCH transport system permease protein
MILMARVFSRPEKARIYVRRTLFEMQGLGVNSIGLTFIISIFIGAVTSLQMFTYLRGAGAIIPPHLIAFATREVLVLEFSSTVVALILAGKVGSSIASEIGTMRITEQIDALEVMGVNSAGYLILPKLIATVIFFPMLAVISIVVGVFGGYAVSIFVGLMPADIYIEGLRYHFDVFSVSYSLIKMSIFAFLITSVSAFYGYYAKDNSLEVGRASTQAVVVSSVLVLVFDLILTQLLLL